MREEGTKGFVMVQGTDKLGSSFSIGHIVGRTG
jgi:hypothetical protein